MRFLIRLTFVLAGVATLSGQAGQTDGPAAADLAKRLQARYQTVRDFTADFSQTYQGVLLRKGATETGKLLLKKPSRIRMTYEKPEKKTFVSDGSQFYSYFPENRAGSVHALPKNGESSTALLFIAGRGDLTRDFTPSLAGVQQPGEWQLKLVPRTPQSDFQTLTLIVNRATLALNGFVTVDDQGTNTIRFLNVRENTGLRDDAFIFQFPKGTQIER
ncbi:MAG TPA: outer membrane lipoprotein carrier protein LolA [Vicinamibacterales bacterium]|nr:outer membrane lipoprotein carrier protein LolA [Vicinamibacterales bacterium]